MADRLDALTVREHNGKSFWTKIGAAFPSNGGGWIVRLDAVPASVDGQYSIHLREPLPRDGGNDRGGGQRRQEPQGRGRSAFDDDIGQDSVPY